MDPPRPNKIGISSIICSQVFAPDHFENVKWNQTFWFFISSFEFTTLTRLKYILLCVCAPQIIIRRRLLFVKKHEIKAIYARTNDVKVRCRYKRKTLKITFSFVLAKVSVKTCMLRVAFPTFALIRFRFSVAQTFYVYFMQLYVLKWLTQHLDLCLHFDRKWLVL